MRRFISVLLSSMMVISMMTFNTSNVAVAATEIDFDTMPIPKIDTTNVGYNLSRTMTILENSTAENPANLKIAITGQSICDAPWNTGESSGGNTWTIDIVDWLKAKYPTANISSRNFAIGGFAGGVLRKRMPGDIKSFYPDLVIFYDYASLDQYKDMFSTIRQETEADILVLNNHYCGESSIDDEASYEILPSLVDDYSLELCDIRTPWKKFIKDNNLQAKDMLRDDVHLNEYGQTFMLELIKQHFVYRPVGVDSKLFADRIPVTSDMWEEGVLSVPVKGNRVEVVAGSGEQHAADVTLNGYKPSEYPLSYQNTLQAGGMYGTKLGIVKFTGIADNQNWTVKILSNQNGVVEFEVTGSKKGIKYTSENGVCVTPEITLDSDSFITDFGLNAGSEITFSTYFTGCNVYNGSNNVLFTALNSTDYELVITARDKTQVPDIKELVVYNPTDRIDYAYVQPTQIPQTMEPIATPVPVVTPGPGYQQGAAISLENLSFEDDFANWNRFANSDKSSVVDPTKEDSPFNPIHGTKVYKSTNGSGCLDRGVTLEENTYYKVTYYRYGGKEKNQSAEVMLTSHSYDQAPYPYSNRTWKPILFTETPMGDGWVKCVKIYPPKIVADDNGNPFNYKLAVRGWGADSMTVYLDNISVTKFDTMSLQTPDVELTAGENNVAEFDVFGLEPGRTYKLAADVVVSGDGDVTGGDLKAELQYASWNKPAYPDEAVIVYKSNNKAKGSMAIDAAGDKKLEADVLAYSVPKDLPFETAAHKVRLEYTGDNANAKIKVVKFTITETAIEVTTVPEGGTKPVATPPPTPKPTPTPTPTPTAKPSSATTPTATPSVQPSAPGGENVSASPTATSSALAPTAKPSETPSVPAAKKVKKVKFAKKTIKVKKGKKAILTLKVKLTPAKGLSKKAKNVKWSINKKGKKIVKFVGNAKIYNGKLKARVVPRHKKGKAKITCKAPSGKKAVCKIVVK